MAFAPAGSEPRPPTSKDKYHEEQDRDYMGTTEDYKGRITNPFIVDGGLEKKTG